MDVLGPWFTHLTFDGGHQGGGFAADKGPASQIDLDVEVKAGAKDVLPQKPASRAANGPCKVFTASGYSART